MAKKNMLATQNNNTASAWKISAKQVHTRDELAKKAKVSHDTYGKAKKIIDLEKNEVEECTTLFFRNKK